MTAFAPQSPHRRTAHRAGILAGLLALVLVTAACGGSSAQSTAPSPTRATSSTTDAATAVAAEPTAAQAALVAARPFEVHTPPGVAAAKAKPLLVLLHGFGASGAIQESYLKLTTATEAHDMLYVYLDGTLGPQDRRFWNATDACCAFGATVDDSAYITAVIADVKAKHKVDPRRVFLVGHSNGGFMSYRMSCDHADEIAAIVSIAGATWQDTTQCKPAEAVAILEIHGTADKTIKYEGGANGTAGYPSATTTVEAWAKHNGCSPKPDAAAAPTHAIVENLAPATVTSYSDGCDRNGHSELWTQADGAHIPLFTPTFAEQIITFLLAHPKR